MSMLTTLQPASIWKMFDLICSIPHPSGQEEELAQALAGLAAEAGLQVRRDAAGNLRIDRPAAPGRENRPAVLVQAHLDMVPAADKEFDFTKEAITPLIQGDWVTADGTTLGGDDGIGAAAVMALLLDKELQCGPLAGVLTVSEETGLNGAAGIAPDFLAGDYLIGCDHEGEGSYCIGCSGGCRTNTVFTAETEECRSQTGVKITVSGLPGGHSGCEIHKNHPNAIKILADFLDLFRLPVSSINAGTVDNAIPAAAEAICGCDQPLADIRGFLETYRLLLKQNGSEIPGLQLSCRTVPAPAQTWTAEFRERFLKALRLVPNGMIKADEEFGIAYSSTNLAIVKTSGNQVRVCTSQRSADNREREALTATIAEHFLASGGISTMSAIYPAWRGRRDQLLVQRCLETAAEFFKEPTLTVTHGGLECGWFSKFNPQLQIVECGPVCEKIHTPKERLSISSTAGFYEFLRKFVETLAK